MIYHETSQLPAGSPATLAPCGIPISAAPDHRISMRTLHQWWQAAKNAYDACDLADDDPAIIAIAHHITMLEELADSFVPKTIEDWAFKIIIADDDGQMPRPNLVRMAFAQVGIEPSASFSSGQSA